MIGNCQKVLKLHQVQVKPLVEAYTDSREPPLSRHTITGRNPQNGRPLAVTVDDGLIREIQDGRRDEDFWLSPGFVDLQVNGYGGDDVNQ